MIATRQSVINYFSSVTQKITQKISLHLKLLLMTPGRKNNASIAQSNAVSYKAIYLESDQALNYRRILHDQLIVLIQKRINQGSIGTLAIDFSFINKTHSYATDNVTYDYDGTKKCVQKGFSLGFALWTDGKVTIPCDFQFWARKKDAGVFYRNKPQIAKELILSLKKKIYFTEVKLDGAFASQAMIQFFRKHKISFVMRIPRNRVVTSKEGAFQLKDHPILTFQRNQKYKAIKVRYKDIPCFITAHKRNGKKGTYETVFLVSNVKRSAKNHVISYAKRWCIEKFFRTAKQHLGLADCQSTNIEKQKAHIFLVMFSYAELSLIKNAKKKKSIEDVLHPVRWQKSTQEIEKYLVFNKTFMC